MKRKIVSGLVLTTLLVCTLALPFNIKTVKTWEDGTIYIRADGSIYPPDAPISINGNVYTLTDNIQIDVSDADGIVIKKDNIIIDGAGYTLEGVGDEAGIDLVSRTEVTTRNVTIKAFHDNIYLDGSSHCSIFQTNIKIAHRHGIYLYDSSNNNITGNTVTNNNDVGISLYDSSNNNITGNTVTNNNTVGISLYDSSNNNTIAGNTVTNNNWDGISLYDSSNNNIYENNIGYNGVGIRTSGNSSDSYIHHDNFVNNGVQCEQNGLNFWDDGSEGSYWSDYEGIDTDGDGIGDTETPHHKDSCPLISPVGGEMLLFWKETMYFCGIDNSVTVSRFGVDDNKTLSFNVNGEGFVNLTIPRRLLDGSFKVFINNTQIPYEALWDETYNFICLEHATSIPVNVEIEAQMKLQGDLNSDGKIDIRDIATVAKHYGETLEDP